MMTGWRAALAAIACMALPIGGAAGQETAASSRQPVRAVADARLAVAAAPGRGLLALYASGDLEQPQPDVVRAVVIIHGVLRNALTYLRSGQAALAAAGPAGAGTLLLAPQFLADIDADAHHLPAEVLRWSRTGWEGGGDAVGPAPLSSFDALDAVLAALADRRRFPALRQVVVAGHSGGAQVVQRYAILGRAAPGPAVRYVVANPSSYAYFSPERPLPADACPGADRWKYGMQDLPRYAAGLTAAAAEAAYVARDVVYLLGTADTDPAHPALDRSCMAEAQGPFRYARGEAYLAYLRRRHPDGLAQRRGDVPGVGHDGDRMLTSACGLAALFDAPGCDLR